MTDTTINDLILSAFTDSRPLRIGEVQARLAKRARLICPRPNLRVRLGLMARQGLVDGERIDRETIWRRTQ